MTVKFLHRPEGRNRKPARKPGEPLYRCFWCLRWRCHGYFRLCEACQAELDRARAGMPEMWEPELSPCTEGEGPAE